MSTYIDSLTIPVTCRRCQGKGYVSSRVVHAGAPGGCFSCNGEGVVEGDRATIAARKQYAADRTALGRAAFDAGHAAHSGLSMLESNEPERCRKAVASFAAGRTDVIPALVAYFEEAR